MPTSAELVERLRQAGARIDEIVAAYVDPATRPNEDEGWPAAAVLFNIMNSQHSNGSWYRREQIWAPVFTARALELLTTWHIDSRAIWPNSTISSLDPQGIPLAFRYLTGAIDDQHWGKDWYDHAQIVRILGKRRTMLPKALDDLLDPATAFLRDGMNSDYAEVGGFGADQDWAGPAVWAAAAMAFMMVDHSSVEHCIAKMKNDWADMVRTESKPQGLSAWHTANVILALKANATPGTDESVTKAFAHLKECRRKDDGSWGDAESHEERADHTAYVGRAFCAYDPDLPEVTETVAWLKDVQDPDGLIGSLGGTLHGGMIYFEAEAELTVEISVPVHQIVEVRSVLLESGGRLDTLTDHAEQLAAETAEAGALAQDLKAKLDGYIIRLTVIQATLLFGALTAIGVILGIVALVD